MEACMKEQELFVGIDVSKKRLDIAVLPNEDIWTLTNNKTDIKKLVKRLSKLKPNRIVLEATGGLESEVAHCLEQAKLPVVVMNPRQVKDFAKATGTLAKTDAIDSKILAQYGKAMRPELRSLKDVETQDLSGLVTRRNQLLDMRTSEKNRLAMSPQATKKSIRSHIKWLEKEIVKLDSDLGKTMNKNAEMKAKSEIMRSAPGVGPVLSQALLGYLPEIGSLNRKQVAVLAGVAPFNRDSGRKRGKRSVWGGRERLRKILYMATLASTQCNPVIKEFYARLVNNGKPAKVALTACMRKLLVSLNAMVKTEKYWGENKVMSS